MRFLGGFLKFLAILLMLLGTLACTGVAVYADVIEAYLTMGAVLIGILMVSINIWGTGIAVSNAYKNKKKIEQLEKKVQDMTVALAQAQARAQYFAAQPPVVQPPVTEAGEAPVQTAAEMPVQPAAPAPEFAEKPAVSPDVPAAKASKKWIPFAIAGGAVLVVVIAIILIVGGGDKPNNDGQMYQPDYIEGGDTYSPAEPEQAQSPRMDTIPLSIGECLETDDFIMTFDSVEILDEYSYRTSDISTVSLWVEEGYKLLAVRGMFINNGTKAIQDSCFSLTATVNDSYTVEGYDVSLDFERSASFEIDPYTEQSYILHLNIPEKLAAAFETVTFTIGFNDDLSIPVTVWDTNGNSTVETDNLYSLTSDLTSQPVAPGEEGAAAAEEMEAMAMPISIGDTIDTGDYIFTLLDVELTYEVLPPNTSSVYTSYPAESGKVFVHVEADVKNTMQRDIRIEELFGTSVIYDGKYPYEGFAIVNDGDNSFDWVSSYVAATPLETCRAHGLVECPVEVDESGNSLIVYLEMGDETYAYVLR